MRISNADVYTLDDTPAKRQVVELREVCPSRRRRQRAMSNIEKYQFTQPELNLWAGFDELTIRIALIIRRSDEAISRKQIEEEVDSTTARVTLRLKWLQEAGAISYDEQPHENQGMPPSYLYFSNKMPSTQTLRRYLTEARERGATNTTPSESLNGTLMAGLKGNSSRACELATISDFLAGLKRNAADSYTKLLLHFAQNEEITMKQAEEITGELRQTNHGRFKRLVEAGILLRDKKRSAEGKLEYHYFLSPEVSKDEIAAEASRRNISINGETQENNHNLEVPTETMTDSKLPAPAQLGQRLRPSATELLLEKLPEFDPTWPEDVKASWLKSYQELINMVKK